METISQNASSDGIRLRNKSILWNQFSDFTGKEFVERFGLRTDLAVTFTTREQIYNVMGEALPNSKDWTEYVTPAKDPGQCAFSVPLVATWAVESHEAIRKGKKGPDELSAQQIMDCSSRGNQRCPWSGFCNRCE